MEREEEEEERSIEGQGPKRPHGSDNVTWFQIADREHQGKQENNKNKPNRHMRCLCLFGFRLLARFLPYRQPLPSAPISSRMNTTTPPSPPSLPPSTHQSISVGASSSSTSPRCAIKGVDGWIDR